MPRLGGDGFIEMGERVSKDLLRNEIRSGRRVPHIPKGFFDRRNICVFV